MRNNVPDDLIDVEEAARYAGVTIYTIRRWAREKFIRKFRRGLAKKIFYSKAEIDAYIDMRPIDEEVKD